MLLVPASRESLISDASMTRQWQRTLMPTCQAGRGCVSRPRFSRPRAEFRCISPVIILSACVIIFNAKLHPEHLVQSLTAPASRPGPQRRSRAALSYKRLKLVQQDIFCHYSELQPCSTAIVDNSALSRARLRAVSSCCFEPLRSLHSRHQ
jgi:hypothetical protein